MIVADSSAIVELLLGTHTGARVAARLREEDAVLAPELVEPEVLQALRRYVRTDAIALDVAETAIADFGALRLIPRRHAPLRDAVWALRDRCSAYDAEFVALAARHGIPLLTADARLARACADLVDVELAG